MIHGMTIWACGTRVAAVPDGPRNNVRGEGGHRIMKRTLFEEPSLDNSGGQVAGLGETKVNCLAKSFAISLL